MNEVIKSRDYKGTTANLCTLNYPTQEELLLRFSYNKETGELRNKATNTIAGSYSIVTGYFSVAIDTVSYTMARIIYIMVTGELPTVIDHVDGNTTNNKWENLRSITSAQNSWNRGLSSLNTSGVKGLRICTDGRAKKYLGNVTCKGICYTKYFKDREDAEAWIIQTRSRLHGDFAHHG